LVLSRQVENDINAIHRSDDISFNSYVPNNVLDAVNRV
jgi:hypothetical protein